MSGHADTIRRSLPDCSCETHQAVSSALDALLAENQRLREALDFIGRHGVRDGEHLAGIAREALRSEQ